MSLPPDDLSGRTREPSPPVDPPPGMAPPDATASVHTPPPGTRAMNVARWALFAGLLALAAVSIGAYALQRMRGAGPTTTGAAMYHCPMHPSYTSRNKNDECPICGMDLVPIPAATSDSAAAVGDVPGLTGVHLSPERIQMIGVRWTRVEKRPLGGTLDLVGFVAPDESRIRSVQLRVSGWVQQLHVNRTGQAVRAGEPMLSIYSPELYQTQRELLIEIAGAKDPAMRHGPDVAAAARQRLRLLGLSEADLERVVSRGEPLSSMTLSAPVSGVVLEKNVSAGQYVGADTPLFTMADLSRLWVLADLYELDYGRARAGDRALFTADGLPGRVFEGRVEQVYPTVSSDTRTLKLRLSVDNPGAVLKPGMFGRVRVVGRGGPTLVVPSEAVVNAGDDHYVFLAHAGGRFEPRRVTTGVQDGDWIQVLGGVAEGDTVVSSASFLIDSESRLQAAIEGMGAQPSSEHGH